MEKILKNNIKIVYFAPIDWGAVFQRPQHIAQRFAEYYNFLYIQPFGLRNLQLSDSKRLLKRLLNFFKHNSIKNKVHIKNFFYIPIINNYFSKLNKKIISSQLNSCINNNSIVWIATPSNLIPDFYNILKYKILIYEMMDDWPKMHPLREKEILYREIFLINKADIIIVTSKMLLEKAKRLSKNKKNIFLLTNGVDFNFFNRFKFKLPDELNGIKNIAGYIGSIEKWIDFETIEFLAEKMENINFVFIGPVGKTIKCLPDKKNIHFLGERKYDVIPNYCNAFDVCLIPFKKGGFSDSINPVKLYEYFSLGKPVVSYEMRELLPFREYIYLACDNNDFMEKLILAFDEKKDNLKLLRKEIAKKNDWNEKVKLLADLIKN